MFLEQQISIFEKKKKKTVLDQINAALMSIKQKHL